MSKQDLTDTMDFSGFNKRKPLGEILKIPPRVQSVYSLITVSAWTPWKNSSSTPSAATCIAFSNTLPTVKARASGSKPNSASANRT